MNQANDSTKYSRVEHRKIVIEMSFRAGGGNTQPRGRRESENEDAMARRMKREGMFV